MKVKTSSALLLIFLSCSLLNAPLQVAAQQTTLEPPRRVAAPAPSSSLPTWRQQQEQQQKKREQQSQQPGTTTPQDDDADDGDVVRITTNLVQIDAVVTGKDGAHVTDLRPEDFEIREDGKVREITNFSYVSNETAEEIVRAPGEKKAPPVKFDRKAPPVPSARLKPEQVRRTVALVADDLGLSFESTKWVRDALRKYVDEQMQPGDLVAVIRSSAGVGALQQFTTDRRQLHAAIDRIKWSATGRGGIGAFGALDSDPLGLTIGAGGAGGNGASGASDRGAVPTRNANAELENFREEVFTVGTLGALNYVVRGLRELPGRKSVVLFSDGIRMYNRDGRSNRVRDALYRLTDLANRASVVFYTLDARGLVNTDFIGADVQNSPGEDVRNTRSRAFFDSQGGLSELAEETGGFLVKNNNDLNAGIRRVLNDQKGFYLIGYKPDAATFNPAAGGRRFHKFEMKVKRPGLKVRTRGGFFGFTDEEARPSRRTPHDQILAALTSPFSSGGVALRLTTVYLNDAQAGPVMRSLLHIEGKNLEFKKQPDGLYKAELDVVALTFGDNGRIVDEANKLYTIRSAEAQLRFVREQGLLYTVNVPVKKPGAYQMRVAVRDGATELVGSASQFIEVPDLKKNRLSLSGVIVAGGEQEQQQPASATTPASNNNMVAASATTPSSSGESRAEEQVDTTDPQASPAVRRFRQRTLLDFFYHVYNAKLDKATGQPQLEAQSRIFRDGQVVFTGQPFKVNTAGQTDMKRVVGLGRLRLGTNLPPGEYALQVVVTDALAEGKSRLAAQWIDFEIVGAGAK